MKELNGLSFHANTKLAVMLVLSTLYNSKERVRFWYGDGSGKSWNEENDVMGRVGRSTGSRKIPLLIKNSNSTGGGGIICDRIIKIVRTRDNRVLYVNNNFNQSVFKAVDCEVLQDGETFAPNCKSPEAAQRLADYMNGKRHSK